MIKNISRLMMLLLLLPTIGLGSTSAYKENDSLVVKSYEDIAKAVDENWKDSTRAVSLAKAWIQKAKKDHNYKQLARAYRAMFHKSGKHQRLLFADSILSASKSTSDASLIGSAYLTKGVAYYEGMESSKALDQYLIADRYISQIQDTYLIHKTKYLIAQTKYYLGFYHEAIALFRECIEYYKEEDDLAYLNALHGLSLCYYSVGQYDLCTETVNHGIAAGREFEYTELEMYFLHAEGVNQYFKRNYQKSIALLSKVLPQIKKKKDYANAAVALFYMGKNNWDLNRQELAVGYFKMVDGSFAIHGYLRPDLREGYEILIDYYKKKGDYKSQVAYYDRLSQADKVLNKNYKYLSGRILKEYNNKEIVQGKRNAEHALQMQKIYYGSVIILLSSALTHFIYRYYSNQKRYRRKFEELMQRNTSPDRIVVAKKSAKELDLLPEVAETIYKNLLKFEKNKKYLEKDMNLVKIAAALHTNQRYATKIIWHYRDKKTIEYITDLKIDYIVDRFKNDSRFRLYTHKALGMEAGFGSTQIFTKSFKARCGMSPTFFVSELQKERNSMDS